MGRSVVLVNGLPGSGKSTLAARIGAALSAPVLSKDAVKQALADAVGPAFVSRQFGSAAMGAVWALAAAADGPVVLDSFWFRPRDLTLARAGLQSVAAVHAAELWCQAPIEVSRARYSQRRRHPVHADDQRLADDWTQWVTGGAPLALCPVITVDTATPPDLDRLLAALAAAGVTARTRPPR